MLAYRPKETQNDKGHSPSLRSIPLVMYSVLLILLVVFINSFVPLLSVPFPNIPLVSSVFSSLSTHTYHGLFSCVPLGFSDSPGDP